MHPAPETAGPRSAGLTYQDYLQLPDNERTRQEILDGDLAVTPSPGTRHQRVSLNLTRILDGHVRRNRLGELFVAPTDVILAETSVVVPDLFFVRAERREIVKVRAVAGAPDLVVEIISPSTSKRDRETKLKLYARCGVPHYWVVHPGRRWIELHELDGRAYRLAARGEGDATIRPSSFPGLEIDLRDVWAD
jgi:Uma2 family endonuclease